MTSTRPRLGKVQYEFFIARPFVHKACHPPGSQVSVVACAVFCVNLFTLVEIRRSAAFGLQLSCAAWLQKRAKDAQVPLKCYCQRSILIGCGSKPRILVTPLLRSATDAHG